MRAAPATFACLAAVALLGSTASARADDDEPSGDVGPLTGYRSHRPSESPQRFALELRFGPYRPDIDSDFDTATPYDTVFGGDRRLYLGLELDWQALRIPGVGTLGPGLSVGYTHMSANAKLSSTGADSAEQTTLSIMPMYAVGVLRVDVLARETAIPLVPYAKAGLGYGLWWAANDTGTSTVDGVKGRGATAGTHWALGGMFLLDAIDPRASVQLDNETGVNNSYFYFEWMRSNLDGFGDSTHSKLRVGTSTWVMGLALEM